MEELLHLGLHRGAELREASAPGVVVHLAHDLDALVGGEPLEDLGGPPRLELVHDLAPTMQGRLVEHLDGPGHAEHRHHRRRLVEGDLVHELGQIGRGKLGHGLADAHDTLLQAQANAFQEVRVFFHCRLRTPFQNPDGQLTVIRRRMRLAYDNGTT